MDKIKNYFTDWTMFEKLWLITVCAGFLHSFVDSV